MGDKKFEGPGDGRFRIADELARVRRWIGGPSIRALADLIDIGAQTLSELARSDKKQQQNPTLRQIAKIGSRLLLDPTAIFDDDSDPFALEDQQLRWRIHGELAGAREYALRVAAAGVVMGRAPEEIAQEIATVRQSSDPDAAAPTLDEVRSMALAGFSLDLMRPSTTPRGVDRTNRGLALALAQALEAVTPGGIRPKVHVVRNLAHPDFERDPAALFLVAQLAHQIVSEFLATHRAFTIGIAGGPTLAAFVSSINGATSPFPNLGGRLILVPLTLEPMSDHRFHFADALVGEMARRAAALLGPAQVSAPSFKTFAYREDQRIDVLKAEPLHTVRFFFAQLDVAIFGCGDPEEDGWISRTLDQIGVHVQAKPVTDVAMNMLDEHGRPIPLPSAQGAREFVGVNLREIQRVAKHRDKLALLLTSGAHKGLPLTVVARAGCANAIVCDEAAARAALEVLRSERDKPRAA